MAEGLCIINNYAGCIHQTIPKLHSQVSVILFHFAFSRNKNWLTADDPRSICNSTNFALALKVPFHHPSEVEFNPPFNLLQCGISVASMLTHAVLTHPAKFTDKIVRAFNRLHCYSLSLDVDH